MKSHDPPQQGSATLRSRYEQLTQKRAPYLSRARECASLTIPYIMPQEGDTSGQRLPSLFQSIGANGVTNLASKLLLTMLPPNEPCFRLRVNNLVVEQEEEMADQAFRTKVDKALSRIEQAVLADIEATGDRPVVNEGNLHLIVTGNVLYYNDPEQGLRLFPLSRYVVERDPSGMPTEILVEEETHKSTLPDAVLRALEEREDARENNANASERTPPATVERGTEVVTLYTRIRRAPTKWTVSQECGGIPIPEAGGSYPLDGCPWFPVRLYSVAGEDYGRSFVEMQQGDLMSLESLTQALVEGSTASAKIVGLVSPNGTTSARALAEAANGDFIEGDPQDVAFLQVQKGTDFQVVAAQIQTLEQRLKTAFLMMDGIRRHAERVTAEEIRLLAQELETGLGGIYTVISNEFQLPYIASRIRAMTRAGKLPDLPKGIVQPSVVTGFEALGRGNDKARLLEFLQAGSALLGEAFISLVNPHNAVIRLAASMGIASEGLVKDEATLAQEQQAAQQAQAQKQGQSMLQSLAPEAIKQLGSMAQQAVPPQPL